VTHQRRAQYENALHANTALSNLLERNAGKEDFETAMESNMFWKAVCG
jgi:hypothetical protein